MQSLPVCMCNRCNHSKPLIHGFPKHFNEGKHAVRRSSRYLGGLWSDLVTEQTLTRSVKSCGGLTIGCGMTESICHMWVLSLNHTAAAHEAMNHLSGSAIKTSEQHIDLAFIGFRLYFRGRKRGNEVSAHPQENRLTEDDRCQDPAERAS